MPFYWTFLPFCDYTTRMPLFSRISPACVRVSFNKAAGLNTCNFIKKEALAQAFSYKFYEISKNTFFTEHLWTTASCNRQFPVKL